MSSAQSRFRNEQEQEYLSYSSYVSYIYIYLYYICHILICQNGLDWTVKILCTVLYNLTFISLQVSALQAVPPMMVTFFSANFSNNELKPRPSAVQPGVSAFRVYNVQMLGKISSDVKHTSRFQMVILLPALG